MSVRDQERSSGRMKMKNDKEPTQHDTAEQVTGVNPEKPMTHNEYRAYTWAKQDELDDRMMEQYDYLSNGKECPW